MQGKKTDQYNSYCSAGYQGCSNTHGISWMKPCYQDNIYHTQKPLSPSGHIIPEINPEDPGQIQLLFLSGHFDDQDSRKKMSWLPWGAQSQLNSANELVPEDKEEITKLLPLHWQQGLRSSGNPGSGPSTWDSPWGVVNGSQRVGDSGGGLAHDLLQEDLS